MVPEISTKFSQLPELPEITKRNGNSGQNTISIIMETQNADGTVPFSSSNSIYSLI